MLKMYINVFLMCLTAAAFGGQVRLAENIGGSSFEEAKSLIQTTDGGYAITGFTTSYGAGIGDAIVAKFTSTGALEWTRTLGGSSSDFGEDLVQTEDGGYAVAGYTLSYGAGVADAFLAKFDATGTHQWTALVGGPGLDQAFAVIQTDEGGFLIAGSTTSHGAGGADILLSGFDASGSHLWTRTFGGTDNEAALDLIELSSRGYAISGETRSFGAGANDLLLMRLDTSMNVLWARTVGGVNDERGRAVIEEDDGSLAVGGMTLSSRLCEGDFLLSKFDGTGVHLWSRSIGDLLRANSAYDLVQADDGGYVLAGHDGSCDYTHNVLVSKVSPEGTHVWTRRLRGPQYDVASSIVRTTDGGYAMVNQSITPGEENWDIFLVTLDSEGNSCIGEYYPLEVLIETLSVSTPALDVSYPTPQTAMISPTITSPAPDVIPECIQLCGDANGDGNVSTGDGYYILNYLGGGAPPVSCWSANVNGDGILSSADGFYYLNYHGAGPALDCQPCSF
jgi:hypothetical protein